MATTLPLVRGTLDLLVLRALRWEPTHGAGAIDVDEGSLYPALHRLEERGLIASEWGRSEHNRRSRTYQVTAEGRDFFWAEQERWERYKEVVDRVLRYGTAGGILGR